MKKRRKGGGEGRREEIKKGQKIKNKKRVEKGYKREEKKGKRGRKIRNRKSTCNIS